MTRLAALVLAIAARAICAPPAPARNRLAALAPGTPFKMSVLRAGKVIELTGTSQ